MSVQNSYKEAAAYLENIPKFIKKNTMQQTRDFYEYMGKPGSRSKVIHVAGTNGKGSVCCYLESVLRTCGYCVGTFTSPHLVTVRERMRIGGSELIGEAEFTDIFLQVKEQIKKYQETCSSSYHPSYFEYLYFMAMLFFERHRPDFIILETGLGGRLDATNSFPTPVLSILTRIGLDHTEYLGDTIPQIAAEKAGIIKAGADAVYLASERGVVEIMEDAVRKAHVSGHPVNPKKVILEKVHKKGIDFSYHTGYYKNDIFCLSTGALYQMENVALCVQASVILNQKEIAEISEEHLREGLLRASWAGRMEEIFPGVYLDGAHNGDGIRAFLETVKHRPCTGKRVLLFSVVSDKDYRTMAEELVEAALFDKVVLAPLESSRRADMKQIADLFPVAEKQIFESVEEAFQESLREKGKEDQLYVAGSLYLVGQIKAMLEQEKAV
ncbi:MAG: bifunctional folylpolyglutamate synthase/dihydrofolate synthase [Lachnospiraceae bacterium]